MAQLLLMESETRWTENCFNMTAFRRSASVVAFRRAKIGARTSLRFGTTDLAPPDVGIQAAFCFSAHLRDLRGFWTASP
jgi:hypothetical protein